jgi:hypothetical protein
VNTRFTGLVQTRRGETVQYRCLPEMWQENKSDVYFDNLTSKAEAGPPWTAMLVIVSAAMSLAA